MSLTIEEPEVYDKLFFTARMTYYTSACAYFISMLAMAPFLDPTIAQAVYAIATRIFTFTFIGFQVSEFLLKEQSTPWR